MIDTGSETVIAGKYRVSRMRHAVVIGFKAYVESCWVSPIETKLFDKLPEAEQIARLNEHENAQRQLKSFSLACPLAQKYLETEEGWAKFAQLMLQKHHPEMTEADAFDLVVEHPEEFAKALSAAQGKMPASPKNGQAPAGIAAVL